MIVFNLTDRAPPRGMLNPLDLRVFGKMLKPGEHREFPDSSPLARISGWIYNSRVSVDVLPTWYKAAKKRDSTAVRIVPDAEPQLIKPKGDSVTVDVGAMEVVVSTGPDEKLGTEDDVIEVKPKKRGKKGKKK